MTYCFCPNLKRTCRWLKLSGVFVTLRGESPPIIRQCYDTRLDGGVFVYLEVEASRCQACLVCTCRQHFSSKHKTGCFLASFKTSWLMLCCSSKKVAAAYMIAPDWTPKEKGKSPHSSECHSCCGSLFITLQMGERKVTELRNILHKKRKILGSKHITKLKLMKVWETV